MKNPVGIFFPRERKNPAKMGKEFSVEVKAFLFVFEYLNFRAKNSTAILLIL